MPHRVEPACCYPLAACMLCQVREVGSDASWRSRPLTHAELILRILRSRGRVNPLIEAPWAHIRIFRMDWLHVADLGCTADFMGNFFHVVIPLFPGNSKKEQCAACYAEMSAWYQEEHIENRFDCLLPTFFEPSSDGPYKLRGSAAKIRALVPFAWKLAQEMLDITDPVHAAIRQAAYHLDQVYSALSERHPDPCATMKEHGMKFALQYVGLHDHLNDADDKAWRIKPKLHLFMHITSDNSIPRLTWTYRDEDFGGSVARMARRRGGLLRCSSVSHVCLSKFKMSTPCIRVM